MWFRCCSTKILLQWDRRNCPNLFLVKMKFCSAQLTPSRWFEIGIPLTEMIVPLLSISPLCNYFILVPLNENCMAVKVKKDEGLTWQDIDVYWITEFQVATDERTSTDVENSATEISTDSEFEQDAPEIPDILTAHTAHTAHTRRRPPDHPKRVQVPTQLLIFTSVSSSQT